MDSIPFEDHRQILDAAEKRIAELESENAKLRSLCAEAHKQGIYWRHGQEPEQRDWNNTWQALEGEEE